MRYLPQLLALLSGVTLASTAAPWEWETGVWLWPLPLYAALWLWPVARWQRALWLGLLAGLGWSLPAFQWVRHSSRVLFGAVDTQWMGWGPELMGAGVMLALAAYLALYPAVWAVFLRTVALPRKEVLQQGAWWQASLETLRCAGLAASSWVALEWLRGWLFTGLSWNGLGAGLAKHVTLIQVADIVGATGLAFTPVFAISIAALTVWRIVLQKQVGRPLRWHFDVAVAAVLIAGQLIYGIQKLAEPAGETLPVKVALVQPNIPQAERWAAGPEEITAYYQRYAELTRLYAAVRAGEKSSAVDLVVWPESAMVQYYDAGHPGYFDELMGVGNFSLLSGTDVYEPAGETYVSAALFHRGWNGAQLYHKRHLVPFGEYLPLRWVPGMVAAFGGLFPGDFQHGQAQEPLRLQNLPGVDLLPLICFEDTVARVARQGIRAAPQLLVNVTNDGWFLNSAEPRAHLLNAMLRCVELRRPMVRACNTGVSSIITDRGLLQAVLDDTEGNTFLQGVLPGTVLLRKDGPVTFYARWGDAFAMLLAGICAVSAAQHLRRRSR